MPFAFDVTFFSTNTIHTSQLPKLVTITLSSQHQSNRHWCGIITTFSRTKIDLNTNSYQLELTYPIHCLRNAHRAKQFFNTNELSIALELLTKHQIEASLLGIQTDFFDERELIQQTPNQSDFDFFHQLLARLKVHYWIKDDNTIVLFQNPTLLPNSRIDYLHYLPHQKQWVDGVPHFYGYQQSNKTVIKSSLSHLQAGHHLSTHLNHAKNAIHWYVIEKVAHNYEIDELGYENQTTLISANKLAPTKQPKHLANHINKGKIKSELAYANLDETGNYQYELSGVTTNKPVLPYQPYAPRLTPLANQHQLGLHFPLQQSDEIIMGYPEGDADKPLILANLNVPYQSPRASPTYKQQSVIASSDDLSIRLDDSKQNEFVQFNAGKNICAFINETDHPRIHFSCKNTLHLNAVKNINYQSEQHELQSLNTTSIDATNQIEHTINENYYETNQELTSLQTEVYQSQGTKHWQVEAQHINLIAEKQIHLTADTGGLHLTGAKKINLETKTVEITSDESIELGTPKAFIQKKSESLNLRANSLKMAEHESIHYFGEMEVLAPPHPLQNTTPSLKETQLKHQEKAQAIQ